MKVSRTEGYAETADRLVEQYESRTFADVHKSILHLIPTTPCRVLDVGAGTGRDASNDRRSADPTRSYRRFGRFLILSSSLARNKSSMPRWIR